MDRYAGGVSATRLAVLLCALASAQTTQQAKRKVAEAARPECSAGAICFNGEVSNGKEFRKSLNADLDFVLQPGWTIAIEPKRPQGNCNEFASVVNAPYRAHRALYIDLSYGWTAEEEVLTSPREFQFVTNCKDWETEAARLNIAMWPYNATEKQYEEAVAKLGSTAGGKGRLWITGSKVSGGRIMSMNFSVEIKLPEAK